MRYLLSLLTALPLAFIGCATTQTHLDPTAKKRIIREASEVDLATGVSQHEALLIAQSYMIRSGFDYDWVVDPPQEVRDDQERNSWSLQFRAREDGWGSGPRRRSEMTFEMLLPKFVSVNKETGEVSVMTVSTRQQ